MQPLPTAQRAPASLKDPFRTPGRGGMQVTNVLERAHLRSNTGHSWRGGSLQEGCPEQGTRGEGIPYWPYALKMDFLSCP